MSIPEGTKLYIEVVEGRELVAMDDDGFSDPYVIVNYGSKTKRTKVLRSTLNPKWRIGSQSEKFKLSELAFHTAY